MNRGLISPVTGPARRGKGAYAGLFEEVADGRSIIGGNVCCESVSMHNLLVHGTQAITAILRVIKMWFVRLSYSFRDRKSYDMEMLCTQKSTLDLHFFIISLLL